MKTHYFMIYKLACLLMLVWGCSKMDATYKEFIKDGPITYVGSPDSVKFHPGRNRIKLSMFLSDLSAKTAKLYWNNKSDSLEVHIDQPVQDIWLNDVTEGSYSFDIFLLDDAGNRSVRKSVVGRVYGEEYEGSLLARPVNTATLIAGKVSINWGTADPAVFGTLVNYFDLSGKEVKVAVPVTDTLTVLNGFDFDHHSTFSFTTKYIPDSLAVDTFFSTPEEVLVIGPPIEYDRSSWTAPAEDYDTGNSRPPQNVLDGKTSTIWHMDKGHAYPHHITIDMKQENTLYGLTYIQRLPLDGAVKLVDIEISNDGIIWTPIGSYTFKNSTNKEYLELLSPVTCRFFRLNVRSDYKGGGFTAIAEIGAYTRE